MAAAHRLRSVQLLDGLWDFTFCGQVDPRSVDLNGIHPEEKVWAPSAFDASPRLAGKRGVAVYRTEVTVPRGRPALLEFEAVSMWSSVFVDGNHLAQHACGYTPFRVALPPSPLERRIVHVVVDNRFSAERAPMHEPHFDFYQYGGILRSVRLHLLPEDAHWISSVQVTPTEEYAQGEVDVAIQLAGPEIGDPLPARFTLRFDDAPAFDVVGKALDGRGRFRFLTRVPRPRTWSPEQPHLHRLEVVALTAEGMARDDAVVRFGLRAIEARDGALWLNGQPLRLRGYNRHEFHPNFGPCTPAAQMASDLQLMRDLGCNFIRGAHYPQSQQFLDLCDEMGFLVWEENLGWQQSRETLANPQFRCDHLAALRAMVAASYNHPSVIIWGFLNEAATDQDYVRPVFEESVATLRALDGTRLVSYASCQAEKDRHFDLVDLIAINIYPGWYGCEGIDQPLELIAPHVARCFASVDARGFQAKPVIVAEIGAEGLYGWRDANHDFFTEEYQAEYLRRACAAILHDPRSSGVALWLFSDMRASGKGRSLARPRAFNNKGTFDEYRRPKLASQVVRAAFLRDAELHASAAPEEDLAHPAANGLSNDHGKPRHESEKPRATSPNF